MPGLCHLGPRIAGSAGREDPDLPATRKGWRMQPECAVRDSAKGVFIKITKVVNINIETLRCFLP